MTQVLYRKWRPMTFEQVVAQDHVTQTLRNALALGRVGHAYLLSGPRGTGKTTTARLLAKAVNCLAGEPAERPCNTCRFCQSVNQGRFLDLIEIDAASNTGVDDVRDLREKVGFSPNEGRFKVYIIDEVHMLSTAAFNALLKTLEEPPSHAIFVLATTEIHKIPATVLSRCQRFEFRRIPLDKIVHRLQALLEHEGVNVEPGVLNLVARQATGALRDAESLLDQLLSSQSEGITLEYAQAVLGTANSEEVEEMVAAWIAGDSAAGLGAIERALDSGTDPQQFLRQAVDYLRGLLFFKSGGAVPVDIPETMHRSLQRQAEALEVGELLRGVRRFSAAVSEAKGGWQPQLPLELAFVESVSERLAEPAEVEEIQSVPTTVVREVSTTASTDSSGDELVEPVPSSTPGASASADVPPAVGSLSEDRIKSRWGELKNRLRQNKQYAVGALLNSGQFLGVEDQTVVLGYPEGFIRDKMQADNNRKVLEKTLTEMLGTMVRVRCVDPQNYQPVSPPIATDSEEIKRFAVEELDAQVVESDSSRRA
jgi:DNA polymerase-3 subunit gamma/tau